MTQQDIHPIQSQHHLKLRLNQFGSSPKSKNNQSLSRYDLIITWLKHYTNLKLVAIDMSYILTGTTQTLNWLNWTQSEPNRINNQPNGSTELDPTQPKPDMNGTFHLGSVW